MWKSAGTFGLKEITYRRTIRNKLRSQNSVVTERGWLRSRLRISS